MISHFILSRLNESHLEIYSKCFNNAFWLKLYGFNEKSFNLNEYIRDAVLTENPFVEKLIVANKDSLPLLFSHIWHKRDTCIIVGGIIPELINSGQGIYCSQIILDYLFTHKNVESITVSILEFNTKSLRMVEKMGFQEIQRQNAEMGQKIILKLNSNDYPNHFSKKILSRLMYEKE